jgi:Domain of unknown function (DUF4365)
MSDATGSGIALVDLAQIPPADRTGRIGVLYMRELCALAGLQNSEPPSGEDHLAVDLSVQLPAGPAGVQVKSGTARLNNDGTLSVSLEANWVKKWSANPLPVYLLYVRLSKRDFLQLAHHGTRSTTFFLHAYWVRVNGVTGRTVRVPRENRFTVATFHLWNADVRAAFGKEAL